MIELNYKEFGQGEPIIILHGLFGTLDFNGSGPL